MLAQVVDRRYVVRRGRDALVRAVLEDALVAVGVRVPGVPAWLQAVERVGLLTRVVPARGPGRRVAEALTRRGWRRREGAGHAQPVVRRVEEAVGVPDEVVGVPQTRRVDLDVARRGPVRELRRGAGAVEAGRAHVGH